MPQTAVTLEAARQIAALISKSPAVIGVDVFGSVMYQGYGSDLDLVIVVSDDAAAAWWKRSPMFVPRATRFRGWYHRAKKKVPLLEHIFESHLHYRVRTATSDVLGLSVEECARSIAPGMRVDVALLPEGWRVGKMADRPKLSAYTSHAGTLDFFERIAPISARIS